MSFRHKVPVTMQFFNSKGELSATYFKERLDWCKVYVGTREMNWAIRWKDHQKKVVTFLFRYKKDAVMFALKYA